MVKKTVIAAVALMLVAWGPVMYSIAQTKTPKAPPKQAEPRRLTVTLNEGTWIALINTLDRADVSHLVVRQLQDSLNREFVDSTKNKIIKP